MHDAAPIGEEQIRQEEEKIGEEEKIDAPENEDRPRRTVACSSLFLPCDCGTVAARRVKLMTLVAFEGRTEQVRCSYHLCSSLVVQLYRNGYFASHPAEPTVAFDTLLMDLLFHDRFGSHMSVEKFVKGLSHLQVLTCMVPPQTDISVDYNRLVAVLPYYGLLRGTIARMQQLNLSRPVVPKCPACGRAPHSIHSDGCFQISRQVGTTVAARPTVYEGSAVVVPLAAHENFMEVTDQPERQRQEKKRKQEKVEEVCECWILFGRVICCLIPKMLSGIHLLHGMRFSP